MTTQNTARTPVKASSRLLTMKFMRTGFPSSLPKSNGNTPHKVDQEAIDSAIAEEEAKREAALIASGAAEERWYLNFATKDDPDSPPGEKIGNVRVIVDGQYYRSGDTSDSDDSQDEQRKRMVGRMSFGGWTRKEKATPKKRKGDLDISESGSTDSDASSNSSSDSDSSDEEEKKRRKKKEKLKKKKQAAEKVRNNGPNGKGRDMSTAQQKPSPGGLRGLSEMKCFNCGKTGHFKSDCLQKPKKNDKHDSKRRKTNR